MGLGGSGGGGGSISGSSDVALNSPVSGQALQYNGSQWQNVGQSSRLVESVNAVTTSGTAQTLPDVSVATLHTITLTANCTLTLPALGTGKSFLVRLVQDTTGSRTVTWPSSIRWQGGTAPTLSTAAGAQDFFSFVSFTGTGWTGFVVGQGY